LELFGEKSRRYYNIQYDHTTKFTILFPHAILNTFWGCKHGKEIFRSLGWICKTPNAGCNQENKTIHVSVPELQYVKIKKDLYFFVFVVITHTNT